MAAVDCILKLGGSALTQKSQLETLKTESLRRAAVLVSKLWEAGERRCIIVHGAGLKLIKNNYIRSNKYLSDILEDLVKRQRLNPGKIGGWQLPDLGNRQFCAESKEPLHVLSSFADLFTKGHGFEYSLVPVPEACSSAIRSFGHFQAREYGVALGTSGRSAASDNLRQGLCLTRLSVTKLNHLVTEQLISVGVPAVGISVFGIWKTTNKNITEAGIDAVKDILDAGYIPVLHGDCALDLEQHCCILSGDTIIEVLAKTFCPRRVVFLTDVNGIYSCPPDTPGARLLDSVLIGPERTMEPTVLTSALPHDTTGGVSLKLQTAINIVSWSHGSIPVLICKLDSNAALKACLTGELEEGEGTKLSFVDT